MEYLLNPPEDHVPLWQRVQRLETGIRDATALSKDLTGIARDAQRTRFAEGIVLQRDRSLHEVIHLRRDSPTLFQYVNTEQAEADAYVISGTALANDGYFRRRLSPTLASHALSASIQFVTNDAQKALAFGEHYWNLMAHGWVFRDRLFRPGEDRTNYSWVRDVKMIMVDSTGMSNRSLLNVAVTLIPDNEAKIQVHAHWPAHLSPNTAGFYVDPQSRIPSSAVIFIVDDATGRVHAAMLVFGDFVGDHQNERKRAALETLAGIFERSNGDPLLIQLYRGMAEAILRAG